MIFLSPQAQKFHKVSLLPTTQGLVVVNLELREKSEAEFQSCLCHVSASVTTGRYLASPSLRVFIYTMQVITSLQGSIKVRERAYKVTIHAANPYCMYCVRLLASGDAAWDRRNKTPAFRALHSNGEDRK